MIHQNGVEFGADFKSDTIFKIRQHFKLSFSKFLCFQCHCEHFREHTTSTIDTTDRQCPKLGILLPKNMYKVINVSLKFSGMTNFHPKHSFFTMNPFSQSLHCPNFSSSPNVFIFHNHPAFSRVPKSQCAIVTLLFLPQSIKETFLTPSRPPMTMNALP